MAEGAAPSGAPKQKPPVVPSKSIWDVDWVKELPTMKEVRKLKGYETFVPVLTFEDSPEEMRTPGLQFGVKYVEVEKPTVQDLFYTPKFKVDNETADVKYTEMEKQLRIYYAEIIKKVVIPNEKLEVGMYGVVWDKLPTGVFEFRRAKMLGRRFKVNTSEDYKILVELIDHGQSFTIPYRRVMFLEQRFTRLPRRILNIELDNLSFYTQMNYFELFFRNTLASFSEHKLKMSVVRFEPSASRDRTSVIIMVEGKPMIHGIAGAVISCLGEAHTKYFRNMTMLGDESLPRGRFSGFLMFVDETTGDVYLQTDSPFYRHFQELYSQHEKEIVSKANQWKGLEFNRYYFAPYKDGVYYRCRVEEATKEGIAKVRFVDEGDTSMVDLKKLTRASDVHPLFDVIPDMRIIVKLCDIDKNVEAAKMVSKLLEDEKKILQVLVQIEEIRSVTTFKSGKEVSLRVPFATLWGYYKFQGDEKAVITNLNQVALSLSENDVPVKSVIRYGIPDGDVLTKTIDRLTLRDD